MPGFHGNHKILSLRLFECRHNIDILSLWVSKRRNGYEMQVFGFLKFNMVSVRSICVGQASDLIRVWYGHDTLSEVGAFYRCGLKFLSSLSSFTKMRVLNSQISLKDANSI